MTDRLRESKTLFFKHILRKAFLEDWGLKLTALVITLALWFGVTGLSAPTKERLTVPLILTISSDTQITNTPRQEVQIEISGDKRNLERINRGDLAAVCDLTAIEPGDWVISLSPDNVSVAGLTSLGIKLIGVQPGDTPVKIEAVAEKDVDVKAETIGAIASGYEVYSSSAMPPKIRVRGPASVVQAVETVQTDKIDIAGRHEDFTAKQIPVRASNPKAAVLNTVVDVYFRIGEKRVERTFTIPVTGSPGKTATFTLYGPKTLISKSRADAFKIDLGSYDTPQVVLPAELQDLVEVRKLTVK